MLNAMGGSLRRRAMRLSILGVLTGCCLGIIGGTLAQAKPGYTVFPPLNYRSFEVRGTNGFDVFVSVNDNGSLEVMLFNMRSGTRVTYSVHVSTPGNLIRARIGKMGRIAMRFEPSGPVKPNREPEGDCHGREGLVQQGFFVGRFRIRGEGGFTEAKAKRVPGIAVRTFRQVCKGADAGPETAAVPETTLGVRSQSPGKIVEFRASARAAGPAWIEEFEADVVESRSALHIERHVFAAGVPGELTFDEAAHAASASPPRPFSGSGELRSQEGHNPKWTGSLEVSFPGLGKVPLAGAGFHASLTKRHGGIVSRE